MRNCFTTDKHGVAETMLSFVDRLQSIDALIYCDINRMNVHSEN